MQRARIENPEEPEEDMQKNAGPGGPGREEGIQKNSGGRVGKMRKSLAHREWRNVGQ